MDLPRIFARPELPEGRLPVAQPYAAQALGVAAETLDAFTRVSDANDRITATSAAQQATAAMDGAIKLNGQQIDNPEEFAQKSVEAVDTIHNDTLRSLNPNQQRLYNLAIANDLQKAKTAIQFDQFKKTTEHALAQYDVTKTDLLNASIGASEDVRQKNYQLMGSMLGTLQRNGILTAKQVADEQLKFDKAVRTKTMTLRASQFPEDFSAAVERGDYKEEDQSAVESALKIAGSVVDARDRRSAAQLKQDGANQYRTYEQQAELRTINMEDVIRDARKYGWDKHQVDQLTNMAIGLKAANPYELKILYDATAALYESSNYTYEQIDAAEKRVKTAAANREISTQTPEYRETFVRLQSLRDRLDAKGQRAVIRGEIVDTRMEREALGRLTAVYNSYFPSKDDNIKAEIANHNLEIRRLAPEQRMGYVDKVEQQLKAKQAIQRDPSHVIEGLRGKLGNK